MSDKNSDNETSSKKPLTLKRSGTLELKQPADSGKVRQSFSHGRTRSVAVEVRRKRGAKRTVEKQLEQLCACGEKFENTQKNS